MCILFRREGLSLGVRDSILKLSTEHKNIEKSRKKRSRLDFNNQVEKKSFFVAIIDDLNIFISEETKGEGFLVRFRGLNYILLLT